MDEEASQDSGGGDDLTGLVPVFLAATVREGRRIEALLEARGVVYAVQVKPYGRTLLGSLRQGAFFYVRAEDAEATRAHLVEAGYGNGVIRPEPPGAGPDREAR